MWEVGGCVKFCLPLPPQSSYHTAWYSVLDPIVDAARQLHTTKVWEDISPKLYTTFWGLSLYDLYVPTGRYEEEVRKAREAIKELEDKLDMVSSSELAGKITKGGES